MVLPTADPEQRYGRGAVISQPFNKTSLINTGKRGVIQINLLTRRRMVVKFSSQRRSDWRLHTATMDFSSVAQFFHQEADAVQGLGALRGQEIEFVFVLLQKARLL